jgi:putative effector of murein hydrolase
MAVSDEIGGVPNLTAVFTILTGVCGAAMGEIMLKWLPLRSALARGALFGMGADQFARHRIIGRTNQQLERPADA